jgi:hypothetical protein
MLQVFHDDVAKVDPDVAMLCALQVCYMNVGFFIKTLARHQQATPLAKAAVGCEASELAGRPPLPTLAAKNLPPSIFLIFLCCKCCISVL